MDTEAGKFRRAGAFSIDRKRQTSPVELAARHYHDCNEIYFLLAGERNYFIRDTVYHIKAGTLVLIPMYDIHSTNEVNGKSCGERILIEFKPTFLGGFLTTLNGVDLLTPFNTGASVICLREPDNQFVTHILLDMLAEYYDKRDGYQDSLRCLLATLLLHVSRNIAPAISVAEKRMDRLHRRILPIVKHMNECYQSNVTLTSLSREFFISKYYLCRSFKKVVGIGVVDYLNNLRVQKAQRLLCETELPVGRVAEEVGFQTVTHFERVFRTLNGTSPLKYRKTDR